MDFQNRAGSKPGAGALMSQSESNVARRERLRKLALETIDIKNDPYFMPLEANDSEASGHHAPAASRSQAVPKIKKNTVKIGRPGYKVTKIRDPRTKQFGLLFEVTYPEVTEETMPRHRFMSAYEQHVEPPNRQYQYLLFAADPYETVAFKVQSRDIDMRQGRFWSHWDMDTRTFTLQFFFRNPTRSYGAPQEIAGHATGANAVVPAGYPAQDMGSYYNPPV
ncbi:CWF complex protein sap62 [Coemansia sp. RSA 1646]|nr:CWF complex protein sap62 [Coemansia sp. RSA 1646]